MNTNTFQVAQQLAGQAGWHLSGIELAALLALPHTVLLHFWGAVKFWAHVQGWNGIAHFLKTGSLPPKV